MAAQHWSSSNLTLKKISSSENNIFYIIIFYKNICSDPESNRSFINFVVKHPLNWTKWAHAPKAYSSAPNKILDGERPIRQNNFVSSCSSLPKGLKQIFKMQFFTISAQQISFQSPIKSYEFFCHLDLVFFHWEMQFCVRNCTVFLSEEYELYGKIEWSGYQNGKCIT